MSQLVLCEPSGRLMTRAEYDRIYAAVFAERLAYWTAIFG